MGGRTTVAELEAVLEDTETCFALIRDTADPYLREQLWRLAELSVQRAAALALAMGYQRPNEKTLH